MDKKQIVIIGAGPAGLTAALELLKYPQNYQVTILEESQSIGGISQTLHHNANRIDIGGHRFFTKDNRIMAWWQDILPLQGAPSRDDLLLNRPGRLSPGGPDPQTTDEVMLIRRRVSRIYYGGKFYDYPISLKPETFLNMGLAKTMQVGFSYLGAQLHKLPEDSLENFYINRFGRTLYAMFFEGYTEKVWGRHPREISAAWGAQRVKGLSILKLLQSALHLGGKKVETSLIEEFYYPKFGPGQLWETVAKRITAQGGTLQFGACVTGLAVQNGQVQAVQCADGKSYPADAVFSSMPLQQLVPALGTAPENVRQLAAGLPYRDFITVGLLVNRLALANTTDIPTLGGIVPDCWIYVQDQNVKLGRIQIFNNWSPYMLADPEHTVWIGLEYFCNEGDSLWQMPEPERTAMAVQELKRIGVLGGDAVVLDSCVKKIKKAYPAYFDTYDQIDTIIDYLNSIQNLYCIGRNGQHRYNNMDHSMATAFATVDALRGHGSKAALWAVNTEQEYHEEQKDHEQAKV